MRKVFEDIVKRDVRERVALVLLFMALVSLVAFPQGQVLLHLFFSVIVAVVTDFLLTGIRKRVWLFPRSALVSGLLVGLILDVETPIWLVAFTVGLAIFSKQFIRIGEKHIFNPAAFGLVISALLFKAPISWWAVSSTGFLSIVILVIGMGAILSRLRLLAMPAGFFAVYGVYLFLKFQEVFSLQRLIDPTIILFAGVMLPEYKTSPIVGHWRYSFGIFVVVLFIFLIEIFRVSSPDPLLLSLLIADLLSFVIIRLPGLVQLANEPNASADSTYNLH